MASYPPARHLLRDLQPEQVWTDEDECVFSAPVTDPLRDPNGALALGPMFAVADLALVATAIGFAEDDWCGTLDLAIRMRAPIVDGPLVIACHALRVGGTLITTKAEIRDGDRLAGFAIATSRRMPRNTEFNEPDESPLPGPRVVGSRVSWAVDGSGFAQPYREQLGLVEVGPGGIELAKTPYVTNSFGTINGGTTGIVLCAAAESALGHEYIATDIEARYVGQAGAGPVRSMCEVVRVEDDHAVVDVTVVDTSHERRPIATAGVTLVAR